MNKLINSVLTGLAITFLGSCAQEGSPSGGPVDTTAPKIKTIVPLPKSTNFVGKSIEINFDEFIKTPTSKKEIYFLPKVPQENYEVNFGNKSVQVKLLKPLEPNTTYQLIYGNSVKDVNAGNTCKTKNLVFSTGNTVDSLQLKAKVIDAFTGKPINALVALYTVTDTLNYFNHDAYYYANAEKGEVTFTNLKKGNYKIIAFKDDNKNLKLNKKEPVAFLNENVSFDADKNYVLKVSYQNLDTLKLISSVDAKEGYLLKFNKGLKDITFDKPCQYKVDGEKIVILKGKEDSLKIKFTATDSLGLVYSKFIKIANNLKPSKNNLFIKPADANKGLPFTKMVYVMDRKIQQLNKAYIHLLVDGKKINAEELKQSNDSLIFEVPNYKDSLNIEFEKKSFISVNNDTLSKYKVKYTLDAASQYGYLNGTVVYEDALVLEVLRNNKVVYKTTNKSFELKNAEPGDYFFRVIKDTDKNGYWTQGNISINKLPEDIYVTQIPVTLKSNWELKDLLIKPE